MNSNSDNDFDLYREVTLAISSTLDMDLAWERTFSVLQRYFPLTAISFHEYRQDLGALKIYFLCTPSGSITLDLLVPLAADEASSMNAIRKPRTQFIIDLNHKQALGRAISRAIRDHVPDRPRAHLINMLSIGEDILTNMSFLGDSPNCFTQKHVRMMEPLLPALSLAMSNLMQFKMSEDFKQKLGLKNLHLEAELGLLQDGTLIGVNGGLAELFASVHKLVGRDTAVLITGETGTGKDIVAAMIQRLSSRQAKPFIKVNCGALADTLLDSELFGAEKGAYTGAHLSRPGRFEQADGGTIFLDEIGELSPQAQVRLLRVLQNKEVERLGSTKSRPVDVRVIAATNSNLENMLQTGTFREDLYYRLNVFRLQVPPLRERPEDIIPLMQHFVRKTAARFNLSSPRLDFSALDSVLAYSWPGNVRELENLVERAMIENPLAPVNLAPFLPKDKSWYLSQIQKEGFLESIIDERLHLLLEKQDMPPALAADAIPSATNGIPASLALESTEIPYQLGLDGIMGQVMKQALRSCHGKIHGPGGAAELLRINPSTLRQRMRKMNISAKDCL